MNVSELDLELDGRVIHCYDTGPGDGLLATLWHGGSPNIGAPPAPLFEVAEQLGLRLLGIDRPAYGGSTRVLDRSIAAAAGDARALADHLGIEHFVTLGHSGGGAHALACAALLPERVLAAVSICGMAPFAAPGLDFYAGMTPGAIAQFEAATRGREAAEREQTRADDTPPPFTEADWDALRAEWSWFFEVVNPAIIDGAPGYIDDQLASVRDWGFDPKSIAVPLLFLHGERDLMVPADHSRWLARACPRAELRLVPEAGHISVLYSAPDALRWLRAQAP